MTGPAHPLPENIQDGRSAAWAVAPVVLVLFVAILKIMEKLGW